MTEAVSDAKSDATEDVTEGSKAPRDRWFATILALAALLGIRPHAFFSIDNLVYYAVFLASAVVFDVWPAFIGSWAGIVVVAAGITGAVWLSWDTLGSFAMTTSGSFFIGMSVAIIVEGILRRSGGAAKP